MSLPPNRFRFRYRSNGRVHTCTVAAFSADEARSKMQQLDWAPGSALVEGPDLVQHASAENPRRASGLRAALEYAGALSAPNRLHS